MRSDDMSINKYNAEGYYDPTAYEALTEVEKGAKVFRPLVYICSPYSGDVEGNTKSARRYSRFAVEMGYIPFTPHLLYPQFLDDSKPKERDLGLFFGSVLMSKCSEVWVFGGYISSGMKAEIERARHKKYTIRYFSDDCEEVSE
jgi:hypothetical protein